MYNERIDSIRKLLLDKIEVVASGINELSPAESDEQVANTIRVLIDAIVTLKLIN